MATFDAYYKWLGITREEQPPTYYRLLGISPFESDSELIQAAVDRQTVYLQAFQAGPNAELAEQLLSQVARAGAILLAPQTKAKYDDRLRQQMEVEKDCFSHNDPLATEEFATIVQPRLQAVSNNSSASFANFLQKPWVVAITIAILASFGLIVLMLVGARDTNQQPIAANPNNTKTKHDDHVAPVVLPSDEKSDEKSDDTGVGISTAQQQAFEKTWLTIFEALGERDFHLAEEQLVEMEKLAGTSKELLERQQRLSQLTQYTQRFASLWKGVLANLNSGDELKIGANEFVVVVEVTDTHLTIKSGQLYKYPLAKLPPLIELAVIQTRFNLNRAGPLMAAGAYYFTKPEAKPEYLDKAREFWSYATKLDPSAAEMLAILSSSSRPSISSSVVDSPVKTRQKKIPSQDETETYLMLLKEAYAEEIEAAIKPMDRQRLAAEIFALSEKPVSSDAELYVILRYSYILARDSQSVLLTDKIRTKMAQLFSIDVLSYRLSECEFWEGLVSGELPSKEQVAAYDALVALLEEIVIDAEADERYDIAVSGCEQLLRLNPNPTWQGRKEQLELAVKRYASFTKANEILKDNPNDPTANLAVGKYLGLTRGSWGNAVPYLAKGADLELRQLAKAEQRDPPGSLAMESLGDSWLEYAEKGANSVDQLNCYLRAATWYQHSVDNAESPIRKLVVEKKLSRLAQDKLSAPEEEVASSDEPAVIPEKAGVANKQITLDFNQRIATYRVEVPEMLNADNLALKVTRLIGFPDDVTVITKDGVAPAGKEVLIGFNDNPLRVLFRLKLSLFDRIAIIQVRSTFRRLETAKTDVVLTVDELTKALVANRYSLNKDANELAAWTKQAPSLERDVKYARSQSTLSVARAKYNRASSRMFYLNSAVRRTQLRIQRLLAIQTALSKIQKAATIQFDVVPLPESD